MVTNAKVIRELEQIAANAGGILKPEDVVSRAAYAGSALHSWFTWDDGEAAHQYRLMQARKLLRVTISYWDEANDKHPVRVFLSLSTDRAEEGGGYRRTVSILNNAEYRKQLLQDAVDDLERVREKYKELTELSEIWKALKAVERKALLEAS